MHWLVTYSFFSFFPYVYFMYDFNNKYCEASIPVAGISHRPPSQAYREKENNNIT